MFLTSDEDKEFALRQLQFSRSNPFTEPSASTPDSATGHSNATANNDATRKIAASICSRFKKEDRFSGKIGEDINEVISNYVDACVDFGMDDVLTLKFFHNAFDGEAKRFYRNTVTARAQTFRDAANLMRNEFNNITRQNRVRKLLQNLRLQTVMNQKKCTVNEALEDLRETITRFTPQGPITHRSEQDKVEYLHDAVIGLDWAKSVLTQSLAASPPWNFQQLYTALDAAWLQEQKQVEGRHRDESGPSTDPPPPLPDLSKLPGIHYGSGHHGQSTYGIPRRPGSSSSNPRRPFRRNYENSKNGKDRFSNTRRCHNCGSKFHLIRDCHRSPRVTKHVGRMINSNPKNTRQVLYELCQQVEEVLHGHASSDFDYAPFHSDSSPSSESDNESGDKETNESFDANHVDNTPLSSSPSNSGTDEFDPTDF